MNIENKRKVKLSEIKPSKNNPRVIKNKKYFELVESLKSFPEMQKIRTIVVDENMITLGGNQRLKAAKDAGLTEVWIDQAIGWSEKRKQEFIIKDNVSAGEWDDDILANEFEPEDLNAWGLDVPMTDEDEDKIEKQEIEFSEYLDESHNYVVLMFDNDIDWLSAQTHFNLNSVYSKRANGKPWSKGIGRVIKGDQYLKRLKDE
tara:strand:- start:9503 stop:10111 length:609 start_codon:yes stop_codon:yes gene_type:complete